MRGRGCLGALLLGRLGTGILGGRVMAPTVDDAKPTSGSVFALILATGSFGLMGVHAPYCIRPSTEYGYL
ncbi:hypothetical protein FIBSPDRAFT_863986 [Athelia psychrophila]|uniref:Uncharacterized protein n=1 Tax=Athelia psychrophila TaxID=1759441 RepID=A0A166GYX4_9AGAM|nr:hypothetical protein FIBSPDRAFT_863986 [Fibularhizoctonia sp. CBS 109695]